MTQLPAVTRRRPSVLLVDDAELLLESLSRSLRSQFEVTCATSGLEALEILAGSESFSAIICDYRMPGMNGVEVLSRVASRHPAVTRIILTGCSKLDLAMELLNGVQIYKFLCKPCSDQELLAAVHGAVQLSDSFIAAEIERGELKFVNELLFLQNCDLEQRVQEQGNSISSFRQLAAELTQVEGLQAIARVSASVAFEVLGGRGVFVQIYDKQGGRAECSMGPEMSARMISEPLVTPDGTVGEVVADMFTADGRCARVNEQNMLAAIASTAAVAAHNEFRRRERDDAQYATVVALARLSEQRDEETGMHLERVSSFCRLIAESLVHLGHYCDVIDDKFMEDIVRSAPLHDIGKVGIPDAILLKKGKLTASEWVVMKTHAEIGAATLREVAEGQKSVSYLHMGHEIALCHHERWDGTGYPGGLQGTQIPLSARILALADVYDALTSERPYKRAWTHSEAMALIEERRAAHFDPHIVDAFVACHEQAAEIRERLGDGRPASSTVFSRIAKSA